MLSLIVLSLFFLYLFFEWTILKSSSQGKIRTVVDSVDIYQSNILYYTVGIGFSPSVSYLSRHEREIYKIIKQAEKSGESLKITLSESRIVGVEVPSKKNSATRQASNDMLMLEDIGSRAAEGLIYDEESY